MDALRSVDYAKSFGMVHVKLYDDTIAKMTETEVNGKKIYFLEIGETKVRILSVNKAGDFVVGLLYRIDKENLITSVKLAYADGWCKVIYEDYFINLPIYTLHKLGLKTMDE